MFNGLTTKEMKKLLFILLCFPMIGFGQDGSLTADDFFDRASKNNNSSDWQYQIDNYTKCLRIDPDYDISAYLNRGQAYNRLENYEAAIADYTRAIRIDPDYARAYKSRGIAKENAGLPYCSDYKRACELGNEDGCEWYNEQCR